MSSGAATLVLVIVLGGFVLLLIMSYWEHRKTMHIQSMQKGNKRLRREIQRHWGNDDRS